MTSVLGPSREGAARPAEAAGHPPRRERARVHLALFALVVASRLAAAIHYIEDTDSLRFALSVGDYDVAQLRPHFPGYPVFAFLAKVLTALTGSYAIAFSLIGAIATFAIIHYLQRLLRVRPEEPLGLLVALLVFFNPLVWLLGNRYMPDLLGAACALAATHHLLQGRRSAGFLLAGLLAGIRLSHVPFVLPPVLLALRAAPARRLALGTLGVLVWLIPLAVDTGWAELIAAGQSQAAGHFAEFGGTVYTEPELWERAVGTFRGLWAHGLGAYWPLRNPLTLIVAGGVLVTLAAGVRPMRKAFPRPALEILVASWGTYLVWIFLYQNVIHKARHVLPLLPLLILALALGAWELVLRGRPGRALVGLFLLGYATVALVVVGQHRRPTAIAQLSERLRARPAGELYVVSVPLVNFYLSAVGVDAHFLDVDGPTALPVTPPGARIVAVGVEPSGAERPGVTETYYHNPFVNPMWPEITVREYVRPRR